MAQNETTTTSAHLQNYFQKIIVMRQNGTKNSKNNDYAEIPQNFENLTDGPDTK